jgi:hypothetical protein
MTHPSAWRGADRWGRRGHGGMALQSGEVATMPRRRERSRAAFFIWATALALAFVVGLLAFAGAL